MAKNKHMNKKAKCMNPEYKHGPLTVTETRF